MNFKPFLIALKRALGLLPTVDGILNDFHRKIDSLQLAEKAHQEEMAIHNEIIQKSQQAHALALSEANRARAVADKMREFVGLSVAGAASKVESSAASMAAGK